MMMVRVLWAFLAVSPLFLCTNAKNVICGPKISETTVTLQEGNSFRFRTHKGKKYKGNTECTVMYKMGNTCTKMSLTCTKFNTKNRDKKKCLAGDKMTVTDTVTDLSRVYCRKKKPMVETTGDLMVKFTSDAKKHGKGASCVVSCTEAATGSTTIAPAPDPCENSGCSVQTYYGTPDTLALFTKNIFAIWWDPKHDHLADAEPLADILIGVRDDCLSNLGMKDPPNPGTGFYYNVYIHHGDDDLFPSGWAMGQGTDPYGFPYLTLHYSGLFGSNGGSQTVYHEGFHIFQYNANSPGFAYAGDSQWYIESSAQWYTGKKYRDDRNLFVEAGAILANPHLALWHSFNNHGPNDPASNEGRPGWMYGVRQYGMHTYLTYLTEEAGVQRNILTDGFYAETNQSPQEYFFRKVGGERMRRIFADWAAHNTGGMDYLTREQLERAYQEITLAGDWDYYRPNIWSAVDEGTGGDWFTPPGDLTARGWAYNVFNINNTQTATYYFELEGDATGSQGAPSYFLGRVVVMSSSGPDYSDMTMTSALSGTATVSVKPKHQSLFLVVASVPEFFSSYQHYGYKVRITKQ